MFQRWYLEQDILFLISVNCSWKWENHSRLHLVSSGHLMAFTLCVEWSSSCLACLKFKKSLWANSALFGVLFQTPRRQKRLFCRYHDGNRNPHLLIAPFKEEDEWDSPHIVRYYDVMSDEEIEKIKQLAKPRVSCPFFVSLMTANSMLQSLLARTKQKFERSGFILQMINCSCEPKGSDFETVWWYRTIKPRLPKVFMHRCT